MPWTRTRIALVACAAASAASMLYVGLFQIGWLDHLACPGFGSGCESVALSRFSYPLGMADGLLLFALGGTLCALAQVRGKYAGAGLVALAFAGVLAYLILALQMQKLGAFCLWTTLSALLSLAVAVLGPVATAPAAPSPERPTR